MKNLKLLIFYIYADYIPYFVAFNIKNLVWFKKKRTTSQIYYNTL